MKLKKIILTNEQKKQLKIGAALVASIAGGYFMIRMASRTKIGEVAKVSISKAMEHSLIEKNGYAYSYCISVNEDIIPTSVFEAVDKKIAEIMAPYLK